MTTVTIELGTLIGGESTTSDGFKYFEFLQIPYAKPPVGDLRFKVPQLPEPWEGQRNATVADEQHICYQYDIFKNINTGSEDCLYLNVYTPRLPAENSKPLPVMVYVHGGGFVLGNGTIKSDEGPDYLIEHDVVIVTINYRLGVFGFLSLDIPDAAGNMGLKDQVMALQWIQKYISHFGGDKDNVTLFGISAGSAAIEFLILSSLCKGLFHKAILQSGSSLNHWALELDIIDLTIKLAESLGYSGPKNDSQGLYDFLMKQSTEALGNTAFQKLPNVFTSKRTYFGFTPSVEKNFGNGDAFLTELPYDILKSGKFNKVKVIKGFCQYEGYLALGMKSNVIKEIAEKQQFVDVWAYRLDDSNMYNQKFKNSYITDNIAEEEQYATDFFGDYDFSSGVWIGNKLMSDQNVDVYAYMFSYDAGSNNLSRKFFKVNKAGASHGDDSCCILKIDNFLTEGIVPTESDKLMIKRMTTMWTDFAKYGNPTPTTNDLIPVQWPLFHRDTKKYLKIDAKLEVVSDYMPDKMAIFEEIYEKYHK